MTNRKNREMAEVEEQQRNSTIYVFAYSDSLPILADTVSSLSRNSVICSKIVVVVPDTSALQLAQIEDREGGEIPVSIVRENEFRTTLSVSLQEPGAGGIYLVSPGVIVPFAWDARLARVAQADPTVGTVSPCCNGAPPFALWDPPSGEQFSLPDIARIDRLAFCLGERSYFELTEFLGECFHVSKPALEALAAMPEIDRPEPGDWSRFLTENGYLHVVSDSVYVFRQPEAKNVLEHAPDRKTQPAQSALVRFRQKVAAAFQAGTDFKSLPGLDRKPVQLHVLHDLGGGAAQWVKDYCLADGERVNLILKSNCHSHAFGEGLALYSHVEDTDPLMFWQFSAPIQATAATHLEYRRAIEEVVRNCCVEAVIVSSLIGHSLDVLDTRLPTIMVGHDYYPYCPAIFLYYRGVCESCKDERLKECHDNNNDFNLFHDFPFKERLLVRNKFVSLMEARNIAMVVPSRSVEYHLARLEKRFEKIRFEYVPHGSSSNFAPIGYSAPSSNQKLRILVLGQLAIGKGSALLQDSLERITQFAEVFLVGSGELAEAFRNKPGVHLIPEYKLRELPAILEKIGPDLGLLLSIRLETFSYTLSELTELGIPVAATNLGSFRERIKHGETGYLFEPDPDALLDTLRAIDADRPKLAAVRSNVLAMPIRTTAEMVADYHRILPLRSGGYARYPLNTGSGLSSAAPQFDRNEVLISQSLLQADMWKEIKRLGLLLWLKEDVLRQTESAQIQSKRLSEEKDRQLAQQILQLEDKDRQLAQLFEEHARQLAAKARQLDEKDRMILYKDGLLSEMVASTSWKISSPVRWVGTGLRKLKILVRCLLPLVLNPVKAPSVLMQLYRIWRSTGMLALKQNLLRLSDTGLNLDALEKCGREFSLEIRPAILSRIRRMKHRPRISILMPTYNTPEDMLRQTIQSVLAQLYPAWELCIADDGSPQPEVKRVLQEYAARDSRIKVHFGEENKGVSHASNMALRLATGKFAVLLDHDDILEEQAIFRVAECVETDDPDMLYSDEALISGDGSVVIGYAFRPAFSPELLRSHPYIVHLVGFRTQLLTDIGGFDESLSISQDYDLILRASEKAGCIVHIPEILYRWRTYENSAGHQKMQQVMDVSKSVLTRHLERCGEKGSVADGPSFNFFDTRYPLQGKARVAIIIPTKNHGDLVRQCIESIDATVRNIPFDIVLVDHASDDAASVEYFETLKPRAQVLRYEGPFNFSAINNWAVSKLTGEYSHYLFCNNDIEAIEPGWLERMMELGQKPSVGMVGAKLFYPDRKTIQHAGVCVGAYGAAEHYGKFMRMPDQGLEPGYLGSLIVNREVSAVTAACLLISKEAFDEVDGFEEQLAVGFGDVDLCLKVDAKGYRVLFCPSAQLVHHESFTRGKSAEDPHPQDSAFFQKKWKSLLEEGDPYFNPNLSLFSTAWHVKIPMSQELEIRRRVYRPDPVGARQRVSCSQSAM